MYLFSDIVNRIMFFQQMLTSALFLVSVELENVKIYLDHMNVFVTKDTGETPMDDVMVCQTLFTFRRICNVYNLEAYGKAVERPYGYFMCSNNLQKETASLKTICLIFCSNL